MPPHAIIPEPESQIVLPLIFLYEEVISLPSESILEMMAPDHLPATIHDHWPRIVYAPAAGRNEVVFAIIALRSPGREVCYWCAQPFLRDEALDGVVAQSAIVDGLIEFRGGETGVVGLLRSHCCGEQQGGKEEGAGPERERSRREEVVHVGGGGRGDGDRLAEVEVVQDESMCRRSKRMPGSVLFYNSREREWEGEDRRNNGKCLLKRKWRRGRRRLVACGCFAGWWWWMETGDDATDMNRGGKRASGAEESST